jgi:hypothetical protein
MGSSPVISTPSRGHEHVPEVWRIHSAIPRSGTEGRIHYALNLRDLQCDFLS